MSERRFTRLKASLSKETAAKTRETVSRELRASMTTSSNQDASMLYCIEPDYERSLRQWNEELRASLAGTLKEAKEEDEGVEEAELLEPEPTDLDLLNCFTVPDDDIQCIHELKQNQFDYSRYYPAPDRTKPSSPFAHECILHYTDTCHLIRWRAMDRHFGTVFDTAMSHTSSGNLNSNSSNHNDPHRSSELNGPSPTFLTSSTTTNNTTVSSSTSSGHGRATPTNGHVFECDLENIPSQKIGSFSSSGAIGSCGFRLTTQNRLIREGSASVISLETDCLMECSAFASSRKISRTGTSQTSGWLTLTRDETCCFLTFYESVRRDKILWHIEVNRKVSKLVEPPCREDSISSRGSGHSGGSNEQEVDLTRSCFRVTKHLICTDQRYTDDWIKDINSNIGEELNPTRELARILSGDHDAISERMKCSSLIGDINLMAAYSADLSHRKGSYPAMKNSVYRVGYRNPGHITGSNIFRFLLSIRNFELQSSDRNRLTTITSSSLASGIGLNGLTLPPNSSNTHYDSFFIRIALFDSKLGKISEDFRFTISGDIKGLRPSSAAEGNRGYDQRILCTASRAQFTVDLSQSQPADVYLVLRIERTSHRLLHFNCSPTVTSSNNSSGSNLNNNKMVQQGIIGSHVEPYAWSLRPLFQDYSFSSGVGVAGSTAPAPVLETQSNFGIFFKLDQSRLSDEFILNQLRNLQSAQSGSNHHGGSRSQTALNGRLDIELQDLTGFMGIPSLPTTITGPSHPLQTKHTGAEATLGAQPSPEVVILNSSLFLSNQFQNSNNSSIPKNFSSMSPILEIQSLRLLPLPYSEYFNLLYIYPQSLKFDSQKVFSKARNISVTIEIRDSDEFEGPGGIPKSLPIIFGRPHDSALFVRTASTAVSRHNVTPDFFEEIKVALPLQFSEKLHVLFTFAHLSCKKDLCTYSVVGYAWLPISPDAAARNRSQNPIHCANQQLSVFASLPNGYLSCQSLGMGKGLSMPDVKFVGKDLFRVSTVLISSVSSRDVDLQTTLSSVIKITRSNRDDSREISQIISLERNLPKLLRSLSGCDHRELIHFSPVILQQLFKLLVFAANQDLILESFRTILELVDKFRKEMNQIALLNQFIEATFKTSEFCGVYVHDQLIILLNKYLNEFNATGGNSTSDDLKLLFHNLWFVLRVMTKSMIQYLVDSGRATLTREDRFEPEFVQHLKRFLQSTSVLIERFSRAEEAPSANQALAHFLTRLCSFFDRAVVFNAMYNHVSLLSSSRDIVIQELKLNSIAILLAHEHFIPYCNPLIDSSIDSIDCNASSRRSFALSSDYARKHFPVFLALVEFKNSYAHRSPTSTIRPISLYIIRNQLAKHLLEDIKNCHKSAGGGFIVPIQNGVKKSRSKASSLDNLVSSSGNSSRKGSTDNLVDLVESSPAFLHRLQELYRDKVLALYLPILSVILDNTNRMVDSTIAAKDGNCTFGGCIAAMHYTGGGGGSGGRPGAGTTKSTSPYSTVNEMPSLYHHYEIGAASSSGTGNSFNHLTRSTSEISSHSSFSTNPTLSSVSSFGSLSSAASTLTNATNPTLTHQRTNSMVSAAQLAAAAAAAASGSGSRDRFSTEEVRDLFTCLLSVVQVLDIRRMNQLASKQLKDLFLCLECALNAFEYKPAQQKWSGGTGDPRSKTLPSYLSGTSLLDHPGIRASGSPTPLSNHSSSTTTAPSTSAGEILQNYLLAQNLSVQSALITLRTIHLYLDNDQRPIDTAIVAQILSIYLTLMSLPQSQSVLMNVFDSIRYFVQKFALLLFNSDAFLSPIIAKVIKYCNSALTRIRQGATDLLYCLLSTNLKRTRFETIVCVSRLASSDQHGLLYLQSSLNRIEQLATVDTRDSGTHLMVADSSLLSSDLNSSLGTQGEGIGAHPDQEEVSILHIVGRIREILKATKQIREESSDPYLASELRLQLANSYARTSRSLLRTWLENLAEVHVRNRDWAEAAMCLSQVIAILIEQLSSKEIDILDGMLNICKVSENIYAKESIKQESDWLELEESHVSIEVLEKIIADTVDLYEKAELYELAPHVLKVMVCSYEREYEHKKLAQQYQRMAKMHSKVQEINDSGKRLFDTFFRIAFFYPDQYGDGQKTEFIYKVAKVVSLAEMTGIMQALYPGASFLSSDPESLSTFSSPQLLNTSNDSDPNNNNNATRSVVSIVITHVTPYVEGSRNAFEKNVGVSQFVYEQRLGGKIAVSVAEQYKRRVILTVANSFPFFLKRIPVGDRREVILSPIEVAIDEMQERVHQLEHVISSRDAKHLQLVLQGSVNATVNAGPIAYANAFLRKPIGPDSDLGVAEGVAIENGVTDQDVMDSSLIIEEDLIGGDSRGLDLFSESQKHLKFLFEQFLDLCESALKLNEKLIKPNQVEYHQNLKANFDKLRDELDFFHDRPTSIQIFDVISGSTFA